MNAPGSEDTPDTEGALDTEAALGTEAALDTENAPDGEAPLDAEADSAVDPEELRHQAESRQAAIAALGSWPEESTPLGSPVPEAPKERTAAIYWLLLAVLFVFTTIFRRLPFDDNEARHVIFEFISVKFPEKLSHIRHER